jgi:hypothetical protein
VSLLLQRLCSKLRTVVRHGHGYLGYFVLELLHKHISYYQILHQKTGLVRNTRLEDPQAEAGIKRNLEG